MRFPFPHKLILFLASKENVTSHRGLLAQLFAESRSFFRAKAEFSRHKGKSSETSRRHGTSGTGAFPIVSTLTRLNIIILRAIPREFLATYTSTPYCHRDNFISALRVALAETIAVAALLFVRG